MILDKVNPMAVRQGDTIAQHSAAKDMPRLNTRRKVKRVSPCAGNPNMIHLDHECYDTRFSVVWVQVK